MSSNINNLQALAAQLGIEENIQALLDDSFIGNTLAQQSSLPAQIGNVVAADNVTTDRVNGLALVVDRSASLTGDETEEAIVTGVNAVNTVLAQTTQRGEFHEGAWLYGTDYRGDPVIDELYTFTRLVSTKDNRTLNVRPLTRAQYRPSGATPTVPALQRAAGDLALFEAACKSDDVDADIWPIIALFTDGFMNTGDAKAWRAFIQAPGRREKWQVFAVCIVDKQTIAAFLSYLRRTCAAKFQDWMKRLSNETTEEQAAARLLFEASTTGYGFFVANVAGIANIKSADSRLRAELYLVGEEYIIKEIDPYYTGQGGLSIPAENVLTAWHSPEEILHVLQVKLSSSLVRASQIRQGTNAPTIPANADKDSIL